MLLWQVLKGSGTETWALLEIANSSFYRRNSVDIHVFKVHTGLLLIVYTHNVHISQVGGQTRHGPDQR